MAGKIFISYRLGDSDATIDRLHERLSQEFGQKNLRSDIDQIPAGSGFAEHVRRMVGGCQVCLAVIGPEWLTAKDAAGQNRLGAEGDFVTEEIKAAIAHGMPLIPLLVDGAALPKPDDLPADLKDLARRESMELRQVQFRRDANLLVDKLRTALKNGHPLEDRWPLAAAALLAVFIAGWLGLRLVGVPLWVPWGGTVATAPAKVETRTALAGQADPAEGAGPGPGAAVEPNAGSGDRGPAVVPGRQGQGGSDVADGPAPARGEPKSGTRFRDMLANGQACTMCPELVKVPAGSFQMGSPPNEPMRGSDEDAVKIAIASPFGIAAYPTTFDEWDACVSDGGCGGYRPDDRSWGRGRQPVINVSWNDVKRYLDWLSRKTGKQYRLPSEAEREYVTRAATTTPFWWGAASLADRANYDRGHTYGNGTKGKYLVRTVPVDSFQPNPWGLFQVHGNVWDWTEDCWNEGNAGNPADGTARRSGDCKYHVLRGGSWVDLPQQLRAANRDRELATSRGGNIGFRVARSLGDAP